MGRAIISRKFIESESMDNTGVARELVAITKLLAGGKLLSRRYIFFLDDFLKSIDGEDLTKQQEKDGLALLNDAVYHYTDLHKEVAKALRRHKREFVRYGLEPTGEYE